MDICIIFYPDIRFDISRKFTLSKKCPAGNNNEKWTHGKIYSRLHITALSLEFFKHFFPVVNFFHVLKFTRARGQKRCQIKTSYICEQFKTWKNASWFFSWYSPELFSTSGKLHKNAQENPKKTIFGAYLPIW